MTSRDFCYWLQGFFELRAAPPSVEMGLTPEQTQMIRRHLALVFKHEIDPGRGDPAHQFGLNQLYNGLGQVYCAPQQGLTPEKQKQQAWEQGPRPDGTQVRC